MFAKACEIFILELTLRAWMHTDECKRRTLQRNDVAVAISRSDTFDFLIDIVPREEAKLKKTDVRLELSGPLMHRLAIVWESNGGRCGKFLLWEHFGQHGCPVPGPNRRTPSARPPPPLTNVLCRVMLRASSITQIRYLLGARCNP